MTIGLGRDLWAVAARDLQTPCRDYMRQVRVGFLRNDLLRLFYRGVGHCRTSELVGRFHRHPFAIFGYFHKGDNDNCSILFVSFFDGGVVDQFQSGCEVQRVSACWIVLAIELYFMGRTAIRDLEAAHSASIGGEGTGRRTVLHRLHLPGTRQRVRSKLRVLYSDENCFSSDGLRSHRVGEQLGHSLAVRRHRFDSSECDLAGSFLNELDRSSVNDSHRDGVKVMTSDYLICSVRLDVNSWRARRAVVHAILEEVFLWSPGESQAVHLHLPSSIESTLREHRWRRKQKQYKKASHGHLQWKRNKRCLGTALTRSSRHPRRCHRRRKRRPVR